MTTRISRDDYGLALAEAAALRADCTRRQVGAVIVAEDGSVVATGYNGRASGLPGCASEGACPRGRLTYDEQPAGVGYAETSCDAAHAEANAIIRAGRDRCVGATIYVTDEPCHGCSVLIAAAGIARVIVPPGKEGPWRMSVQEIHADAASRAAETVAIWSGRSGVMAPGDEAWLSPRRTS